ncbi:MAG: hypothetical protein AABY83_03880, partial [Pseudomonadota bacterium]
MKMKMNVLAAAVALVSVAGINPAQATIADGYGGNGQLFLTVWDNVANTVYVRNLNLSMNDFLPNSIAPRAGDNPLQGTMTPEAGVNMSFAGDALFTSTFAASSVANIQWTVAAGDALTGGTFGFNRELFTTNLGQGAWKYTNGAVSTGNLNINTFLFNANNNLGCALADACAGTGPTTFQPGLTNVNTAGTGFGDMGFYYVSRTSTNNLANAQEVAFGNSTGLAKWTL